MTLSPPYDPIVHLNVTRSGLGRHGHEQGQTGHQQYLQFWKAVQVRHVHSNLGQRLPFLLRYFLLDPIILNLTLFKSPISNVHFSSYSDRLNYNFDDFEQNS